MRETTAHDPETGDHDRPKWLISLERNQCSRWREIRTKKDVRPITYLKSKTAELVREVSEKRRPVIITQNGVAKVVVTDIETYDRWRATMALLKALAQGEADLERGRTVEQPDAFRRARRAIERAARDG